MELKVEMQIAEDFLPTRRCRKIRHRYIKKEISVNIDEPMESDFTEAFIVSELNGDISLRAYKGKLWKAVKNQDWMTGKTGWADSSVIRHRLSYSPYRQWLNDDSSQFTADSVVIGNNLDEVKKTVQQNAEGYLMYDGKIWTIHGEPRYVVMTFGLGHNHGGTALMLDYGYNPNISRNCYFNALQRDEAIKSAKETAIRRGDTESIDDIGKHYNIHVLDKSMVRLCPDKEHGNGNSLINELEAIVEGSDSSTEAGILAMAYTANHISKGE